MKIRMSHIFSWEYLQAEERLVLSANAQHNIGQPFQQDFFDGNIKVLTAFSIQRTLYPAVLIQEQIIKCSPFISSITTVTTVVPTQ